MKQPYPLFIALRYLRARRREGFISFISLVSMVGIALAVAVLIVVTSVMDGFEHELQRRILGVASHASLYGGGGRLEEWAQLREQALARDDVVAAAPFVEGQGVAFSLRPQPGRRASTSAVEVRGIVPSLEATVSEIGSMMREGTLEVLEGRRRIVIGTGLAETLGVGVGDSIAIAIAEQPRRTLARIVPRMMDFTVAAIFDAGMYEYDQGLVFVALDEAATLFGTGGHPSGLRITVRDVYAAPAIAFELTESLERPLFGTDWTREHVNFFASIRISKAIMFVILSMVIAVAAFNIVSTLVMVVREKRGDIAILRTFGASPGSVLTVFATQGTLIGAVGTALGIVLGIVVALQLGDLVALIEGTFGIDLLSADVYWLDQLPTRLDPGEIARIGLLAFALAATATVYPAIAAARQLPAEALRHE